MSARSVRYYEEQGLLSADRSSGGQRQYTEYEVERVVFIQRMYAAGLSSRTIAQVMPCVESPGVENSDAALATLREERDKLDVHIGELLRTRDALDRLIEISEGYREQLVTGVPYDEAG
ncbi:MerR family transcriptional regulator [Nocardioides sp. BSK12Z-4]|uniref:MerR family transcriptional regulator n=1 Tax=Nocardioides bruguierae TaxID=2945102 RepID=A0A9X2IEH9_9ACTN|nr:MerR family transcriptional regulator [Nocardioides bruguierae]MCM0620317.1 MerR family transcriptional regulator [Nocardioides bruguierae]